jgi:trk system potassium uptake protein TrkH
MSALFLNRRFSSLKLLVIGFALMILLGGTLLSLPISNKTGESAPFLNALFTATSASCVTGLVVYDTFTQYTFFGQLVVLLLIQVGGLGFMTVAVFLSMALGKRIGLKERSLAVDSVSALHIGGVVRFVRRIIIGTAIMEATGAALLALRFSERFDLGTAVWFGIFHAVSSFCNAGFDLLGGIAPYSSLTPYVHDPLVNIVVMLLIIMGGVGFLVWNDIAEHRLSFRSYSLHAKLMLTATPALIVVSALLFWLFEREHTLRGMNAGQAILASLFQVVTPRTAGYNTVDMAALSESGAALTMLLMFIGAGSGSTGGGIKVTTFVVLVLSSVFFSQGYEDINLFRRRLPLDVVKRSFYSTITYSGLTFLGVMIIISCQALPVKDVLFEALSAIGTVGLTTGITRDLIPISRLVIILLMYTGRVGSLSVVMAVAEGRKHAKIKFPEEKILAG